MTALLLAVAVAGFPPQDFYDARIKRVVSQRAANGTEAQLFGDVTEFPDGTLLDLRLQRYGEAFDWKTDTFAAREESGMIDRTRVTVTRQAFEWIVTVPGPGRYGVLITFSPGMQTDAAVQQYMQREFVPYEFRSAFAVGDAGATLDRLTEDVRTIQKLASTLQRFNDEIEAARSEPERFDRQRTVLIERIDGIAVDVRKAVDGAALPVTFHGLIQLTEATRTFVQFPFFTDEPPSADAGELIVPTFAPTGEVFRPGIAAGFQARIDALAVRETALLIFSLLRHACSEFLAEAESATGSGTSSALRAARSRADRGLAALRRRHEQMLESEEMEAYARASSVKKTRLPEDQKTEVYSMTAAFEDAVAALNSASSFAEGSVTEEQYRAVVDGVNARFDMLETKLRTGLDPEPPPKPEEKRP